MSYLVQLLLPRSAGENAILPQKFQEVRDELTMQFGGVTVYSRSSAEGLWESHAGEVQRDEVVLFEVMMDSLNEGWWHDYRRDLEKRFEQSEIVIRAHSIVIL